MARIKVTGNWYEQVEPSTFSENEFEERVAFHAPSVYPFYHVLPFKKKVAAPDETSKSGVSEVVPDLLFIAKDYSAWWVVEVEMNYHSLESHVVQQVGKLANADYGDDEIKYLLAKYPGLLDADQLSNLIKSGEVNVLIIVNKLEPSWEKELKGKATLAVFELYRSRENNEVFRVNGTYPIILSEKISGCYFHKILPRLLGVEKPEKLGIPKNGIVSLLYNGCATEWRRIDEGDECFLTSLGRYPLAIEHIYSIYRQNDGQLVLIREDTKSEGVTYER